LSESNQAQPKHPESVAWKAENTFIKAYRNPDALALMKSNRNAFCLYYVIAVRARRNRDGFNPYNLAPGEAPLGDYENYGMSEKEYRGAKAFLEKHRIAAFRRANRGTIATLLNSDVFDINADPEGEQKGSDGADKGRTEGDQRATINKEKKGSIRGKNGKEIALRFEIPVILNTSKFQEDWQSFVHHRSEIGKPLTSRAAKVILEKLLGMGHDQAILAIGNSIASGWRDVYPPRDQLSSQQCQRTNSKQDTSWKTPQT
jgi:hypothetical protein